MSVPNPRPTVGLLAQVVRDLARAYDRFDAVAEASPEAVHAADAVLEARNALWRHLIADGWVAPDQVVDHLNQDAALAGEGVPAHAEQPLAATVEQPVNQ